MDIGVEHLPIAGAVDPQSIAAAGNAASGWIKADSAPKWLTTCAYGALGGGTVTPTFEQANTSGGGGAKALAWTAPTAGSVNSTQAEAINDASGLDQKNGFLWFRVKLSNVGGTGALVSAVVQGVEPRFRP